ncbi:MAG: hypothetical protein QW728_03435, partial [Thermoplasmata archaeon]
DTRAGTYTLTVSSPANPTWGSASQNITVFASTPSRLVFSPAGPLTYQAGTTSAAIAVQLRDTWGNFIPAPSQVNIALQASAGVFQFSSTSSPWNPVSEIVIPAGSSSGTFYLRGYKTGTFSITASENPSRGWSDAVLNITITPAPIVSMNFTTSPKTFQAGQGQSAGLLNVEFRDAYGNPSSLLAVQTVLLSTSSSSGSFSTSPPPGWTPVSSIVVPAGRNNFSFYYNDTRAGTPLLTISAQGQPWTLATQSETVLPAAINRLVFTNPVRTTAAGIASLSLVIETRDVYNNPSPVVSDITIRLTSSSTGVYEFSTSPPPWWSASGTAVIYAGSAQAIFYYRDTLAGTWLLTASENPSLGWTDASQQITITAGPPERIVFITPPRTSQAGAISASITIQAQDNFGNPASRTAPTTILLNSSSSSGFFHTDTPPYTPMTSVVLPAGATTVSFRASDTSAGTHIITAIPSGTLWDSISQVFSVNPGAVSAISYFTASQTVIAGVSSDIVRVGFFDSYMNPVAFTGTLTVSSNSSTCCFSTTGSFGSPGPLAISLTNAYSASFYFRDNRSGSFLINSSISPAVWKTQNYTVLPSTISTVVIAPESITVRAGDTVLFNATAYDSFGNIVETSFVFNSTAGSMSGPLLYAGPVATTGQVLVYPSGLPYINDTAIVIVEPGPAAYVVITPPSATGVVGTQIDFNATAYDIFGNFIPLAAFSWNTSSGIIDGTGLLTFPYTAGTGWVVAKELTSGISGTAFFTAVAGTPVSIVVYPSEVNTTVGSIVSFNAVAQDAYNNTVLMDFEWTCSPHIGSMAGSTLLAASAPSTGYVNASNATWGISASVPVNLSAGPVYRIEMMPLYCEVKVGENLTFTASAYDRFNNILSPVFNWSTDISTATITAGFFEAGTVPAAGHVFVSAGNITSSAEVRVVPGDAAEIVFTFPETPYNISADIHQVSISVLVLDSFGNPVRDNTRVNWSYTDPFVPNTGSFNITAVSFTAGGVATALLSIPTNAWDDCYVVAEAEGCINTSPRIMVIPGSPAEIEFTTPPQSIPLNTGSGPISFHIVDNWGNEVVLSADTDFVITSNSPTTLFSTDNSTWVTTLTLTLYLGQTTGTFYINETVVLGPVEIRISEAPDSGWTDAKQYVEVV